MEENSINETNTTIPINETNATIQINETNTTIPTINKTILKIDFIGLILIPKEEIPINETNMTNQTIPETIIINYSELKQGKIELDQPVGWNQKVEC